MSKNQTDLFFPLSCPRCGKSVFLIKTAIQKQIVVEDLVDIESIHQCAHIGGVEFFGHEQVKQCLECEEGALSIPAEGLSPAPASAKKPASGIILSNERGEKSDLLQIYSDQYSVIKVNYSGSKEVFAGMWVNLRKIVKQKGDQYRASELALLQIPDELYSMVPNLSELYAIQFSSEEVEVLENHIDRVLKVIKKKSGKVAAVIPIPLNKDGESPAFGRKVMVYPHLSVMDIFNEIPLPPTISFEIHQNQVS